MPVNPGPFFIVRASAALTQLLGSMAKTTHIAGGCFYLHHFECFVQHMRRRVPANRPSMSTPRPNRPSVPGSGTDTGASE